MTDYNEESILPSNPMDRQKILDALKEIRDSRYRVQSEKDFENDVLQRIEDEVGIKKAQMRAFAGEFCDDKASKAIEKNEEVVAVVDILRNLGSRLS